MFVRSIALSSKTSGDDIKINYHNVSALIFVKVVLIFLCRLGISVSDYIMIPKLYFRNGIANELIAFIRKFPLIFDLTILCSLVKASWVRVLLKSELFDFI